MAYVTPDDICNKSVDEILEKMSRPYTRGEELKVTDKETIKDIKRKLMGFFKADKKKLTTGASVHVGNTFLKVTGVLPSSNRAFFRMPDGGKVFSLPIWQLTGEQPEFKFKKGETVRLGDEEFEILFLNPASNSVQLSINGRAQRVSVSKIQKIMHFQATGDELKREE